jgi:hypothetical protein
MESSPLAANVGLFNCRANKARFVSFATMVNLVEIAGIERNISLNLSRPE